MKTLKFLVLIAILSLFFTCKKEKEAEVEELSQTANETSMGRESSLPKLSDDYLVSIYEAQELIKIEQDKIDLRKSFCDIAFLKDHNKIITMGIGRLHNPKTGKSISQNLVERAAKLDAIRWAGYGQLWLKNNYSTPYGQLEGNFNKQVEIVDKAVVGDSLFLFIATNIDI